MKKMKFKLKIKDKKYYIFDKNNIYLYSLIFFMIFYI